MALKRQVAGGSGGGKGKISFSAFGASSFLGLSDAPHSYVDQSGKVVVVKVDESGLEFSTEAAIDRHDVKVSSADVNPQFLEDKLAMGVGMAPTQNSVFDNTLIIGTIVDPYLVWGNPILSFYDPTPGLPVLPSAGDRYLATASANGWDADHIYEFDGLVWVDIPPVNGLVVYDKTTHRKYAYDGAFWRFDISSGPAEIFALPVKSSPTGADLFIIEDSADSDSKKKTTISDVAGLIVAEASDAMAEAAAFAAGAKIVIRTDLI
jgi:hypothetical protein